jgi:hypothetical protein
LPLPATAIALHCRPLPRTTISCVSVNNYTSIQNHINTTDFTIKKTAVISTNVTNAGTEIWAGDENGRETSYLVNDHSFRTREGQKLTAILYGIHPVCLRNDTTMTKIQLLAGENLVGSSLVVASIITRCAAFPPELPPKHFPKTIRPRSRSIPNAINRFTQSNQPILL